MNNTPPPTPLGQLAVNLVVPKTHAPRRFVRTHHQVQQNRGAHVPGPKARHGPYCSLTRTEGETLSRYLTAEKAVLAHQQIEAGKEFRPQLEAYWEGSEDWADCVTPGSQPDSVFRR
jgi:hypothetical protein